MDKQIINLGRVAYNPKGTWDETTNYKKLDTVFYRDTTFYAKKDNIGNTPEENSEYWGIMVKGGKVTNAADEEDLHSVEEAGTQVLKLSDRTYSPEKFSGKGYKILRKNIKQVSIAVTTISITSVPTTDGDISFTINGVETPVTMEVATDSTTDLVAQKVATALQDSMTEYDVSIDASLITLTRKSDGSVTPSVFSASTTGVVCTVTDSTKREFRNILMPNMINQPNTIYEIRYDFTLSEDITVPDNCVLEFDGGSISGAYTITGNNTKIKANKRIFDNNVAFAGTWNCSQIESYWWDIRENDSTYDNTPSLQRGIDLASINYGGMFHISGGKLYVDIRIADHSYEYWHTQTGTLQMKSGVHVVMDSGTTIKAIDNTETRYTIFMFFNIENASIEGGNIKGDVDTNAGAKSSEFGYGIAIFSANNITIKNVNISYCHGDGIIIGRHYDMDRYPEDRTNFTMIPHNIKILNCDISYNGRQGITVCGAIDSIISDCFIYGIGRGGYGTNPQMAIDVEPNSSLTDEKVENLLIEGIKSKLNAMGTITVMGGQPLNTFYNVKNIRIANCACNQQESYNLRLYNAHDTIVTNCSFGTITVEGTYTLTDAPTQIFNCYFNVIRIAKGTNAVNFVGCTVYGDFWNNSIVFLGNNSYISFMNCSVYQMDTKECLRYVDSDDSGALTYDHILYLNCSFGYSYNNTIDSTHATYVNNAIGEVKRFR